jgi:hypothetical protein
LKSRGAKLKGLQDGSQLPKVGFLFYKNDEKSGDPLSDLKDQTLLNLKNERSLGRNSKEKLNKKISV